MDSREAHVALNLLEGVGPVRVRQLLEHFGEAPAILKASKSQLLQVRGIYHRLYQLQFGQETPGSGRPTLASPEVAS